MKASMPDNTCIESHSLRHCLWKIQLHAGAWKDIIVLKRIAVQHGIQNFLQSRIVVCVGDISILQGFVVRFNNSEKLEKGMEYVKWKMLHPVQWNTDFLIKSWLLEPRSNSNDWFLEKVRHSDDNEKLVSSHLANAQVEGSMWDA